MGYPDTAEGFMVQDQKQWDKFLQARGTLELFSSLSPSRKRLTSSQYKLKTFEDHDVDIAIECCGVCGSDIHTITGGVYSP